MNNIFGNASTELAGSEKEKDVLGGRSLFPTGVYEATIDAVYLTTSDGGAKAFNFILDIGGRKYRDQTYVTNKQGGVTYTKDGKKYPLPGYSLVNALVKLTIGKEIPNLVFEKKLVKVYNFELKKEVATEVDVAVELTGENVCVGISQLKEFKNEKDQTGNWVESTNVREFNSLERVFHTKTGQTAAEYDASAPAEFKALWVKEFQGKVKDKTKGKGAAPAATPAAGSAPKSSLFGGG